MDFTVKNKATLSSPYVICQLCHKEQKSSVVPHLIASLRRGEKKACLGFQFTWSSELPHISFSTLTSKHLFLPAAWSWPTRLWPSRKGAARSPIAGLALKARPGSIFRSNLPQFVLNARCLFDVSAVVATLRSHLVSRGQNPRVMDGWMGAQPKAQEPTSKKHCSTCDFSWTEKITCSATENPAVCRLLLLTWQQCLR